MVVIQRKFAVFARNTFANFGAFGTYLKTFTVFFYATTLLADAPSRVQGHFRVSYLLIFGFKGNRIKSVDFFN